MIPRPSAERLVLSRFAHHLPLSPDEHLLVHGIFGRPFRLKAAIWEALAHFQAPMTLQEAAEAAGLPLERLAAAVAPLLGRRLLVPEGDDEDQAVRDHFLGAPGEWRQVRQAPSVGSALPALDEAAMTAERKPLDVLVLGACFAQGVETLLVEHGLAAGFDLAVTVGGADGIAMAEGSDVVIYQLPGSVFLRPLLDHFQRLSFAEIETLLGAFFGHVESAFARLEEAAPGALVLVHNYYLPQHSPLGIHECRAEAGFYEVLRAVNHGILEAARRRARFYVIDEERLFGNHGKRFCQDDTLNLYSHHGSIDFVEREHGRPSPQEPSVRESFRLAGEAEAEQVLVAEYLAHMRVLLAPRPIKCLVVDLDDTLWPGAIGDEGFSMASSLHWLTQHRHAGLHQALKILKARGVLLAVASKNHPEDVDAHWRYPLTGAAPPPGSEDEKRVLTGLYPQLYGPDGEAVYRANERSALMHLHLLQPEDFVTMRVGWEPKSAMIRSIADELGLGLDQVAFLDDHPAERAEVRHHLTEVWVLEGGSNRWRETLLSDPRFQPPALTGEGVRRSEMVRAQLRRDRDRAAADDPAAFLATLGIAVTIGEAGEESLPRVHELIARTNQLNLTTRRHDMGRLQAILADSEARLYTLHVADRYTDYGLVGGAIVLGDELDSLVVSCRVLGLEVAGAFLTGVATLERQRRLRPLVASYLPTRRNGPAAGLLPSCGFLEAESREEGEKRYVLPAEREPAAFPAHCRVALPTA